MPMPMANLPEKERDAQTLEICCPPVKELVEVLWQCPLERGEAWAPKGLELCIVWLREQPAGKKANFAPHARTRCKKTWAWPLCVRSGSCWPTKTTCSVEMGTPWPMPALKILSRTSHQGTHPCPYALMLPSHSTTVIPATRPATFYKPYQI